LVKEIGWSEREAHCYGGIIFIVLHLYTKNCYQPP
jgi:hypothetical protein